MLSMYVGWQYHRCFMFQKKSRAESFWLQLFSGCLVFLDAFKVRGLKVLRDVSYFIRPA